MSPYEPYGFGGDERVRTDDPLLAKQVLSQLSYAPVWLIYLYSTVGLSLLKSSGLKWTRTTDLTLIRRAL